MVSLSFFTKKKKLFFGYEMLMRLAFGMLCHTSTQHTLHHHSSSLIQSSQEQKRSQDFRVKLTHLGSSVNGNDAATVKNSRLVVDGPHYSFFLHVDITMDME
jgi:hypothetical protein